MNVKRATEYSPDVALDPTAPQRELCVLIFRQMSNVVAESES
jgi:hypothetical protein